MRDRRDSPFAHRAHPMMPKGSQLSQLTSALSRPKGKKKKATPLSEHAKVKHAARLRAIQHQLNPFDVKLTRLKHPVAGRKVKGVTGRPAQSKQAGMQHVDAPQVAVPVCVLTMRSANRSC